MRPCVVGIQASRTDEVPTPSPTLSAAAPRFEERPAPTVTCGVYVLLRGDEAIYVGQSVQVEFRILHHQLVRGLDFDRVLVAECDPEDLGRREVEAIRRFLPTLNVLHNPNAPPVVVNHSEVGRLFHEYGVGVRSLAAMYRLTHTAVREIVAASERLP